MAEPKRKIPPIPIEILAFHPAVMAMGCGAYGMLLRLVVHYWTTELRPLPTHDAGLAAIARAHRPTWVAAKAEIVQVLDEVLPILARRYQAWSNMRKSILERGENGRLAARGRQKRQPEATAPDVAPLALVASQRLTERRIGTTAQRASGTFRE